MSRFMFMGLVALAACNGGDSDDTGTNTDGGSTDGGSTTEETATINVAATFLGEPVDCDVIVDGVKVGKTGQDLTVSAGAHTVQLGSLNEDGYYTHSLDADHWTGDSIWSDASVFLIVPVQIDLAADQAQDIEAELDIYPVHMLDWWTCVSERNPDDIGKIEMEIDSEGNILFPNGWMQLNGVDLWYAADFYGEFTGPDEATLIADFGDDQTITNCYASTASGQYLAEKED